MVRIKEDEKVSEMRLEMWCLQIHFHEQAGCLADPQKEQTCCSGWVSWQVWCGLLSWKVMQRGEELEWRLSLLLRYHARVCLPDADVSWLHSLNLCPGRLQHRQRGVDPSSAPLPFRKEDFSITMYPLLQPQAVTPCLRLGLHCELSTLTTSCIAWLSRLPQWCNFSSAHRYKRQSLLFCSELLTSTLGMCVVIRFKSVRSGCIECAINGGIMFDGVAIG